MKKEEVIEIGKLICLDTDEHYQVVNLKDLELVCNEIERRTLERAAVVCEGMRDFSGHSSKRPWPGDYAHAIRELKDQS